MLLITLMEAIMLLAGVANPEELDESEIERYTALSEHKLQLNSASRSRLLSCGLMDGYQVASILDYRSRTGNILSFSELALIDGIGAATAEALKHFVDLKESSGDNFTPGGSLRTLGGIRGDPWNAGKAPEYCYGIKLKVEAGDRAMVSWAVKGSWSKPEFTPGSFSVLYNGKNGRWKIVAGDFNARFGQGLAVWSGFSMSGFSSVSAFSKKQSGISASTSWSSALRGVAGSFEAGRFIFNGGIFIDGLRGLMDYGKKRALSPYGCLNMNYSWKSGNAGLSLVAGPGSCVVSSDWRMGWKGLSFFGELAWDFPARSPAVYAGLSWKPAYGWAIAANGRYYPGGFSALFSGAPGQGSRNRDETGSGLTAECPWGSVAYDWCMAPSGKSDTHRIIVRGSRDFKLAGGQLGLSPGARLALRFKTKPSGELRTDVRAELATSYREWSAAFRYNWIQCNGTAWLWYAEAGRKSECWSAWLRFTLFKVDSWDDRIYAWERDLPGGFSVPAFYGRGLR
ncbi:MAG: hypothetical protein J5764_03810, partial [Bacteroidales bacterium]|nr:hypothetical protein [Bacteroidales bacterium]